MAPDSDVSNHIGLVPEDSVGKARHRARALQIKEESRRPFEALLIEGHFAIEFDGDPDQFGQCLATNGPNRRKSSRRVLRLQRRPCRGCLLADGLGCSKLLDLRPGLRHEAAVGILIGQPLKQLNRPELVAVLAEAVVGVSRKGGRLP